VQVAIAIPPPPPNPGLAGHQLFALKGTTVVEVGTDSCTHASALARVVLQHF
jgi:hypothetical protein